jgi:hypothetical protein
VALLGRLHVLLVRPATALLARVHVLLVCAAAGRSFVFTGFGLAAGIFVALLASLHVLFVASALRTGHRCLLFSEISGSSPVRSGLVPL